MINYYELIGRGTVPIYTKMKTIIDGNQVVNSEKEKLYNYYKCDYCGGEIIITKKRHDMTGGIAIIPHTLTKRGEIKLALCNKCVNPTIREFERMGNNEK